MKVCIINNLYEPYDRGGAEQVVKNITEKLEKDHDIFLISTKPFWKKEKSEKKIYYIHSFYYCLEKVPKIFRLFWHVYKMFDVYSLLRVYFILRQEKPDLVLTHNLLGISFLLPFLFRFLGIKCVHTLHDIQLLHPSGLVLCGNEGSLNSFSAKFYQFFTSFLFSFAKIIVSPSEWLIGEHEKRYFFKNAKKVIMLNPLNRDMVIHKKKKNGVFRFIFLGQIEDHKGVFLLVDAFLRIKNNKKELVIIGGGSKLKFLKDEYGQYENIKILGKIENKEAMDYLRESDCLLVPSLCYENSPTVIYESFFMGVPVVASDIGGNVELVKSYGGLLFRSGNIFDLSVKMEQIIKNPQAGDRDRFIGDVAIDKYTENLINL